MTNHGYLKTSVYIKNKNFWVREIIVIEGIYFARFVISQNNSGLVMATSKNLNLLHYTVISNIYFKKLVCD